jgi:two-component system, NtrC family, response regulator AtoC
MSPIRRGPPREETTSLRATSHESHVDPSRAPAALSLHVVCEGRASTYPLERGKTLVVGRSQEADIRIDEPSVSRRHLALEVDQAPAPPRVTVRDLGSANGVRMGAQVLGRGEAATIEPGVVLEVGTAMLVVQRAASPSPPRRVWSHGHFEGRVQDECSRAERLGGGFAILRVRVAKEDEARALDVLSGDLKPSDLLALFGPGDIEALLLAPAATEGAAVAAHFVELLAYRKIAASAGAAFYPADGRAADQLMAIAGERLRPQERPRVRGGGAVYGQHLAELEQVLRRIARGDINILVTGETGVGKEIVAEMVHRLSPRANKPLVRLNCGAFTETLLASELFGHERGAFTGADRAKVGLLESADGGTVFLDEIGELPLGLQPKLLRVLEEGEVMRVGALRPKVIDVRFVSATNRDLDAESQAGRFRADLYFRLAGFTAVVLPLRERPAEILDLVRGMLAEGAAGGRPPEIAADALAMLQAYAWPGNVRELRNVVHRATLLSEGGRITTEHLPVDKLTMRVAAPPIGSDPSALHAALQAHERQRIVDELARCGGNQTHAARALGISRGTLLTRMDAFGLTRPRKR